jgi:hypothetical protein
MFLGEKKICLCDYLSCGESLSVGVKVSLNHKVWLCRGQVINIILLGRRGLYDNIQLILIVQPINNAEVDEEDDGGTDKIVHKYISVEKCEVWANVFIS